MKVSFDFNPKTNEVTNLTCINEEITVAATKRSPSKQVKEKESHSLVLKGSSLKLTQHMLDTLGVKVGDRVLVNFKDGLPYIVTTEAANLPKGGNLITKSMTVSCKGKASEMLAKFGNEFDYTLESEGYLKLHNDNTPKKVESTEMHPIILDQTDFTSTLEDGEEIDFNFEI